MSAQPESLVIVDDTLVDSETFRSYRVTMRYFTENQNPILSYNVPGKINNLLLSGAYKDNAFARIPLINDPHPIDPLSFCVYREVRPIPGTGRGGWEVVCEYRTRWPVYDGDVTPLHEPPDIEFILDREDVELTEAYGFTGGEANTTTSPVNNTAFDKFTDNPVTVSISSPIITITQNYWDLKNGLPGIYLEKKSPVKKILGSSLRDYENTVCRFGQEAAGLIAGLTVARRQALMESIYPQNSFFIYTDKSVNINYIVPYLRVTFKIKIAPPKNFSFNFPSVGSPTIYHEVVKRNTGTMELLNGGVDKTPISKNGEFVTQPVDLAVNGTALPDGDDPVFIPFLPYFVADWNYLQLPRGSNTEAESALYKGRKGFVDATANNPV